MYLDEFVFRHNRRRHPMAAFQTLLGLGSGRKPTPYERIRGAKDQLSTLSTLPPGVFRCLPHKGGPNPQAHSNKASEGRQSTEF